MGNIIGNQRGRGAKRGGSGSKNILKSSLISAGDEYPEEFVNTGYVNPFWRYSGILLIFALTAVILGLSISVWDRDRHTQDAVDVLKYELNVHCKDAKEIYRFAVGVFAGDFTSIIDADNNNNMLRVDSATSGSSTAYPVYVSENEEIWVADNTNSEMYIWDALSNRQKDIIPGLNIGCVDQFHAFYYENTAGEGEGRVIGSCTGSDSFLIFSPKEKCILETVEIPSEYHADYSTHDILAGPGYIVVTLIHTPQTRGIVLVYSISGDGPATLFKTLDLGSSYDPHVWRNNYVSGSSLYIACQGGSDVWKFSWGDFEEEGRVTGVTAAHGIVSSPDEHYLYVTSITNPTGIGAIYKFDIKGGKFETPSNLNTPLGSVHNIRIGGRKNDKFLITHTAISETSITQLNTKTGDFISGTSRILDAGGSPMGIANYKMPCVCSTCKK